MKMNQRKSFKADFIGGRRLQQDSLQMGFQSKIAGQQLLFKNILILLTVVLSAIANMLAGYVGGFISLYSIVENPARSQFHITLLIVLAVIVTAITQDVVKVTLVLITGFGIAIALSVLLLAVGIIQGLSAFLIFLMTIVVGTGLCLGLSIASFLTIRFAVALADILLVKSNILKAFILLASIFAATVSSYGIIVDALAKESSFSKEILLTSPLTYWLVLLLGAGYGVALTLSAWAANNFRGTPWTYPGLQRFWTLAVGSWRGTSFVDLDLSNANFRNAKLANSDLRARKLYRTCFQGAISLERARVDNQYLDLEYPKVQKLLTHGSSRDRDFKSFNLRGAYLQDADLRGFDFTDTNLTGADLKKADLRESILIRTQLAGVDFQGVDLRKNVLIDANLTEANFYGADLRGCILVRAQVARANFTDADLTGICIEDWSVSSKTQFTDVRCDYIYRKYQDEQPSDRYPADRDFEPGEFATLFAQPEDIVELVFKGEFDYAALSLALYKLQAEASDLDLELKGIEQRGNLSVVKVKSGNHEVNERLVRERLSSVYQVASHGETIEATIKESIYRDYEETRNRLAESERLVRQLAGVSEHQAEALKEMTKKSLGNNFFISGSTITNLAGSGQIEYREAADRVRSIVTNRAEASPTMQQLFSQLSAQNVATTAATQQELIQQILLSEAEQDPAFRQLLLEQGQQMVGSLPSGEMAIALQAAIAQLKPSQT